MNFSKKNASGATINHIFAVFPTNFVKIFPISDGFNFFPISCILVVKTSSISKLILLHITVPMG